MLNFSLSLLGPIFKKNLPPQFVKFGKKGLMFVPARPVQPSLMLVSKAGIIVKKLFTVVIYESS
jgi:hypothetical protein